VKTRENIRFAGDRRLGVGVEDFPGKKGKWERMEKPSIIMLAGKDLREKKGV